jgi:hypothetical protein
MSATPITEDFDDIAQRLKELEREKAQRIERQPIAADEPVKMDWLDYYAG